MKNPIQNRIGQRFVNHWRSQWKSHLGTLALEGIEAVANSLSRHFSRRESRANELPDEPVLF